MTSRPLADRVVLVSGGTQGVGAAIARAAARAGATVAVTGRRPEVGAELVAELRALGGGAAEYWPADVSDVGQAQGTVRSTVERFGRIDGLVNSAGLTSRGTLTDTTPELFDTHIAINLRAPFFLMQAAVRDMLARGAPGAIVNIVTMSAHGGQPYLAPYVAAKAGLVGLTRNAAHAHRFDRIRINGINIGWTETPGEHAIQRSAHNAGDDWVEQAARSLPMGRLARPDDVAELAVLLLSDRSGVVTGSVIDWDQQVVGAYD
ncbi:MAG TPA: SDR family oxidoreductase [Jatrophihabitans sp.]|nr:SDR family oxidoreductase [Jatrophihabitans sp.]